MRGRSPSVMLDPSVSGARGRQDANDAIERTEREGFPAGTVVFLDIERMEKTPKAMRDYYKAWRSACSSTACIKPGYYVTTHMPNSSIMMWLGSLDAGKLDSPPFWVASVRGFSEDKEPHEVGHDFAKVCRDCSLGTDSQRGTASIDVNVAAVRSPSFVRHLTTDNIRIRVAHRSPHGRIQSIRLSDNSAHPHQINQSDCWRSTW